MWLVASSQSSTGGGVQYASTLPMYARITQTNFSLEFWRTQDDDSRVTGFSSGYLVLDPMFLYAISKLSYRMDA